MSDLNQVISLETLRQMMRKQNVRKLLVKVLASNDNSKNQVYLGGNFEILNILPMGEIKEDITPKGLVGLKAPLSLSWLRGDGTTTAAPNSQIILYPQYPEIRLSGFLMGTSDGPNTLMTNRDAGRLLFLGITDERRIIGWVAPPNSKLVKEVDVLTGLEQTGVFRHIPLDDVDHSRERLVSILRDIHLKGWINSWRMDSNGLRLPCNSSQCGGYTLEAELGIVPNSRSEPDFDGWEIKSHSVKNFLRANSGQITLMTPEPTAGYYKQFGAEAFVRKYGYPDILGRLDRLNFGGVHVSGERHPRTELTMKFLGFDEINGKIIDPRGGFALIDKQGNEAATWHFAGLLQHWNRKHAKAAYVPYLQQTDPLRLYSYGNTIRLCDGTDFIRFLKAMASGYVVYDPAIKVERASSAKPLTKRRSQFRIKSGNINSLYSTMQTINLLM